MRFLRLRLQGIRVLNYLDDWLILAHSRELLSHHRDIVLRHIHSLGLRMNAKKSVLLLSQRTVFLGVNLDSIQMQARLAPARISNFTTCLVYDHDGCINDGLGCGLWRQTGEWGMNRRVPFLAHKVPGTQGCLPGFDVFSPRSRGASYHSQNGQYGGCVPHKPSGRFTVVHPGQACAPSSPLVPRQVPFFEGSSRSGNTETCGRFSVETQPGGVDVEPSDGIPDLGSVWQSGGGSLCFSRVIPVPALVLPEFPDDSGHRCVRPPVAECQSVRVSANKADSGSTMQSKGEQCPCLSHSPILALPDLVLGANSPLVSVPLGDSDQAGLAVPASGQLTAGAAATTLRVYVAAIAARRELDEIPLGRHRMVSAFMRGVRRLRPAIFLIIKWRQETFIYF